MEVRIAGPDTHLETEVPRNCQCLLESIPPPSQTPAHLIKHLILQHQEVAC